MRYGPASRYCGDKIGYTRDEAVVARRALEQRERLPMKIYECPDCHRWHVAHLIPLKSPRDWRNDNP